MSNLVTCCRPTNRQPTSCWSLKAQTKKSYLNSGLGQAQLEGERLSDEDVGVVTRQESPLQLLQLPATEVGSASPAFA